MKLSDFSHSEKPKEEKKNITEEDIMKKYNQYKDLPQDQLSQELFKEVSKQKANGTFNYNQLENMLESLRGSLSDENYQNMKRILESLK